MQIKLNTIEDVKNFVTVCSRYTPAYVDVKQDRQVVSGASILGIFSLDLLRPLNVIISNVKDNMKTGFYNNIREWRVEDIV